ncbi:hypothetical protein TNCV_134021 [Trichonephila clavipes]|nr:hypothetical protein TNCV_134021 [Trichonephila clavipes]
MGCPNSRPKGSQICLIGDKSGDWAGQGNSIVTLCRVRLSIVLMKNGFWEPLQEWQHMWLQDVMDIPLGCHVANDQYYG